MTPNSTIGDWYWPLILSSEIKKKIEIFDIVFSQNENLMLWKGPTLYMKIVGI